MEILTIPNKKSQQIMTDGIILGIQELSVNMPFYISIEDLNEYRKLKEEGKKSS